MNFKADGASLEETKKREYLKQQHQLRTMTKSAAPLSADNMIETLLSKKEIFQKKASQPEPSNPKQKVGPWPGWLTPGREPAMYKDIWKIVGSPNGLADTNKLSPLLMTSRLSTETLGYIWSLSNVTVPGSLTQQELYVALALVALAQSGYTFGNSNVVRQLKEAPQPILDLANFETLAMMPLLTSPPPGPPLMMPPSFAHSISSFNSSKAPPVSVLPAAQQVGATVAQEPAPSPVPTITENISLLDISHEPLSLIESSPKKSLAVLSAMDLGKDYPEMKPLEPNAIFSDFQTGADDDFDDFKSADIFTTDMNSLTVLDVTAPKEEEKFESLKLNKGVDDLFPKCVFKPKTPDLISPSSPPYDAQGIQDFGILDDVAVLDPKNSAHFSPLRDTRITDMKEAVEPVVDLKFDLGLPGRIEGAMADLTLEAPGTSRELFSLDLNGAGLKPASTQPSSLPNIPIPVEAEKPPMVTMPTVASMTPVTPHEDKYSALRLLDSGLFSAEPSPSAGAAPTEEFGDFLTADGPPTSLTPQPLKESDDDIQVKCLEACLKLLQEAASTFEAIEDSKVLNEVTSNERGKAYLKEILEVERIGRRIRSTRESCDLISEFENLSKILQPYIEYVKNNHLEEQVGPKCGICLCEHGPAHVKYGINHFHAPCANLYLHMVDPILPIAPVM